MSQAQIEWCAVLWRRGFDTLRIATFANLPEWVICNYLPEIRAKAKQIGSAA